MERSRTVVARVRPLLGEAGWIVFGQVAAVAGALVGVRLMTSLLEPGAYGELALAMTLSTLITQVLLAPLSGGATRFYGLAVERNSLRPYLASVRDMWLRHLSVVVLIMVIALVVLFNAWGTAYLGIAVAATAYAALSGSNGILSGIQNAARQRAAVAFFQGVEPWLRFTIGALMLWGIAKTSGMAMWGYAVSALILVTAQYRWFRSKLVINGTAPSAEDWHGRLWSYTWPISSWGLFIWFQAASDRWSLSYFCSTGEVGLYVVLYQIGYYPISMATGMLVQFLEPIIFARAGDAMDDRRAENVVVTTWRLMALALALTLLAAVVAFCLQTELAALLVGERYKAIGTSGLLPLVVISGGVFAAGQALTLQLMSLSKTKTMIGLKVGTALMGVGFNIVGAGLWGVTGVVLSGIAFSVCYLLWVSVLCVRSGRMRSVASVPV